MSFSRQSLAFVVLLTLLISSGVVAGFVLLYFLKSVIGIDMFDDHSMLHNLVFVS